MCNLQKLFPSSNLRKINDSFKIVIKKTIKKTFCKFVSFNTVNDFSGNLTRALINIYLFYLYFFHNVLFNSVPLIQDKFLLALNKKT